MELDINKTTQTEMDTKVTDFSVPSESIDEATSQTETEYTNTEWPRQFGRWRHIPELNRAITALSVYTAGLGYETNPYDKVLLEHINGWGEDTFISIMMNMVKVKKFGRDAYCEIIRDEATRKLLNLKPLNTGKMKHIVNQQGKLIRYEYMQANGKWKPYTLDKIFHLCNERIANEIHGTSVADLTEWVTDAKQEAMRDWRRISHRSTIRVLYIDEDDATRMANMKRDYADAIKNGEVIIIPSKPGEADFRDLNLPPIQAFLEWMKYLENYYYQAVGIPRVIATSEDYTEAGSKVGFLTFEPVYTNEQTQLEADIWNQLQVKVKFNRPPSLANTDPQQQGNLATNEKKEGAVGFQPNDINAGVGT